MGAPIEENPYPGALRVKWTYLCASIANKGIFCMLKTIPKWLTKKFRTCWRDCDIFKLCGKSVGRCRGTGWLMGFGHCKQDNEVRTCSGREEQISVSELFDGDIHGYDCRLNRCQAGWLVFCCGPGGWALVVPQQWPTERQRWPSMLLTIEPPAKSELLEKCVIVWQQGTITTGTPVCILATVVMVVWCTIRSCVCYRRLNIYEVSSVQ